MASLEHIPEDIPEDRPRRHAIKLDGIGAPQFIHIDHNFPKWLVQLNFMRYFGILHTIPLFS